MKLSVIIPVYNVQEYLAECLDSVINQGFDDMEIICVNDGSTDMSREILASYACRNPAVVVIDKANGGLSSARNAGIRVAKGEYIVFVDSDDMFREDCLAELIAQCDRDRLDVLYYSYMNFHDKPADQEAIRKKTNVSMRKGDYSDETVLTGIQMVKRFVANRDFIIAGWNGVFRRDFMQKHELFFEEGIIYEDGPFAFKMIVHAERVICLNDVCYLRRLRQGSIEHTDISGYHIYSYLKTIELILQTLNESSDLWSDAACELAYALERRVNSLISKYRKASEAERIAFRNMCSSMDSVFFDALIKPRI